MLGSLFGVVHTEGTVTAALMTSIRRVGTIGKALETLLGGKHFPVTYLVVFSHRIGDQYFRWDAACPVIMSRVLYGRSLPSELVDVIKAAVTVPSVCTTPNNEPSTTSQQTEEMAQSSSTQNEGTVRPATAPVDSPPTEPETSKR